MAYNIADLLEHTCDAVPDRLALVEGDAHLTYGQLDERANRIAHVLAERGVGPGDHVGIYGYNSHEWLESAIGCFKLRAVPINVNFRYVENELTYIFDNADLVACVFDRAFAPRLAAIRGAAPKLHTLVSIDDGSGEDLAGLEVLHYDEATAAASAERGFGERSPDDVYICYTGGTTGMPKGVMWRHEDVFMTLGGGIDPLTGHKVTDDHELARGAAELAAPIVFGVLPPLMHGAAQWGSYQQMFRGHTIVLLPKFTPEGVWRLVAEEGVNSVVITGDAMGRPMIEWLEEHPDAYDTSALISVSSSAAIFSPTVKERFLDRFPNLIITDAMGATETGFQGITMVAKGQTQITGGGPTVTPGPDTVVLDDDDRIVEPGSGVTGRLARGGNIPLGYYKDPVKTEALFVTASDGRRYSVPGDWAIHEADGTITVLGRGSVTINTGGEKVHPEEVEQALKDHPAVFDCLVIGVPDERWGQRVAAVVQFRPGAEATLDELGEHARTLVAGYKVPRQLVVVDEIQRSPSGKPDYPWAKQVATEGVTAT